MLNRPGGGLRGKGRAAGGVGKDEKGERRVWESVVDLQSEESAIAAEWGGCHYATGSTQAFVSVEVMRSYVPRCKRH